MARISKVLFSQDECKSAKCKEIITMLIKACDGACWTMGRDDTESEYDWHTSDIKELRTAIEKAQKHLEFYHWPKTLLIFHL